MLKIGPTFTNDLIAAGVSLDGLSWDTMAGTIIASASDDQLKAAEAVLAAHDPTKTLVVVPDIISDRQCFQQLAVLGKVTQADAIAAVKTGTMPQAVTDGISALPADQQFAATMVVCGATQFERLHPLTLVFLSFFGMGEADRDPLWTAASAL